MHDGGDTVGGDGHVGIGQALSQLVDDLLLTQLDHRLSFVWWTALRQSAAAILR